VEEKSPFAYDFVETENKNKELQECQLVTISLSQKTSDYPGPPSQQ
jgi:hypothetical protein